MVEGVVLAAGSSVRAGTFKMMLPLGNKTILEHAVQGMYNVCSRIIIVGGFEHERIRGIMKAYPKAEVVENAGYRAGMFSSVKAGISRVREDRFFLLPGDIPLVPASVYKGLLSMDADIVVPIFNGRKGHPVLMRSALVPEIQAEPDSSSLREFIRKKGCSVVDVDEEAILWDVDTLPELLGLGQKLS